MSIVIIWLLIGLLTAVFRSSDRLGEILFMVILWPVEWLLVGVQWLVIRNSPNVRLKGEQK